MNDGILLKTCENRDNYFLIMKHINKEIVGKEAFNLLTALGDFYDKHPEINNVNFNDFATWFTSVHTPDIKSKELELYKLLVAKVGEASPAIVKDLIEAYIKKDVLSQLQDAILRNKPLDEIQGIVNSNVKQEKENAQVSMDILENTEATNRTKGLRWRLDCINTGAGALIGGDFVLIAGRPNSGKSSWVVSEAAYMGEQLQEDKDVLLFVNERPPVEYKERIYQSLFNIDIQQLNQDREGYKKLYLEKMKRIDKIKLFNVPKFTHRQIAAIIKKHNPGLIVIDMIDHIAGFKANPHEPADQKARSLYRWVGDIPLEYNIPLIGTTQVSDAPGQDSKWPAMEQLIGSRTAKQEAPNLIIAIGRDDDLNSTTRYVSATKNKFKPENEYFRFTCKFDKHKVRFF